MEAHQSPGGIVAEFMHRYKELIPRYGDTLPFEAHQDGWKLGAQAAIAESVRFIKWYYDKAGEWPDEVIVGEYMEKWSQW